jgi:hypothetical protein
MRKTGLTYQLLLRVSSAATVLIAPPCICIVGVLVVIRVAAWQLPGDAMLPDQEQAPALLVKCPPSGVTVQVRICKGKSALYDVNVSLKKWATCQT